MPLFPATVSASFSRSPASILTVMFSVFPSHVVFQTSSFVDIPPYMARKTTGHSLLIVEKIISFMSRTE